MGVDQAPVWLAGPTDRLAFFRERLQSSRVQAALALVLYAALAVAYFGVHVVPHLGRVCACARGGDPLVQMWFLAWWPHALLNGLDPFVTHSLFAPDRVNLGAVMLAPGADLVAAPLTLLFGPFVTFNLLTLASPVLAAFFAFLLCRYVTGNLPAALVGGYLFGFSSYMLGHLLGHLTLVLTFPIPAVVLLTLRLIDKRISPRRFVALTALSLAWLFLSSPELTFTFVLVASLALALALALIPAHRSRVIAVIRPALLAGAIAAVVTSPFIYYTLTGDLTPQYLKQLGDVYGADALGFLLPTRAIAFGHGLFSSTTAKFTGNLSEQAYLGAPLMLLAAWYGVSRRHLPVTRLLFALLAILLVLMLGSHLHVAGRSEIPLPWAALDGLPLLRWVVPTRFGVYVFLVLALVAAMCVAGARRKRPWTLTRVLVILTVLALVPNVGSGLWLSRPHNPAFFTTAAHKRALYPGETVLALPFDHTAEGMLWQAETRMRFGIAEGYLGPYLPPDYQADPTFWSVATPSYPPRPARLRAFLARRDVGAVILDPADPHQWPAAFAELGLRPVSVGGILLYRLPVS